MKSCPDCVAVHEQVKNDSRYEMIEIGENIAKLKEFLRLRDSSPVFDKVRNRGVGVPCFLLEDGTITLNPEEGLFNYFKNNKRCKFVSKFASFFICLCQGFYCSSSDICVWGVCVKTLFCCVLKGNNSFIPCW